MKFGRIPLYILLIVTAFVEFGVSASSTCNTEVTPKFVAQLQNTLTIYGLNADQELEKIWTLPPQFRPFRYSANPQTSEPVWFIPNVNDIVRSPDGCHIAFVAVQTPERGFSNRQLFIYSVASGDLEQLDIEPQVDIESLNLLWSPDSASLAIATDTEGIYVYKVADESLNRFARTTADPFFLYLQWIDNDTIVFVDAPNIHLRSIDGSVRRNLTQFEEYEVRSLFTWNGQSQRLFYATGGLNESNRVFSIDLEGQNRLELDLADYYVSENLHRVLGLVADELSGNVYVFTWRGGLGAGEPYRIFRVTSEGEVSVFMEVSSIINYAALSPDGDTLVIWFSVTANESRLQFVPLSSTETSAQVSGNPCYFIYIDDTQLAYVDGDSFCFSSHSGNHDLMLFDTSTEDILSLISDPTLSLWILPYTRPDVSWEGAQIRWILE